MGAGQGWGGGMGARQGWGGGVVAVAGGGGELKGVAGAGDGAGAPAGDFLGVVAGLAEPGAVGEVLGPALCQGMM